jgi:hypothetical protein
MHGSVMRLSKLVSSAPWQIFDVQSATAQKCAAHQRPRRPCDLWATRRRTTLYTIKVITHQKGVRAFRLDALSDPSLPRKGPGLSDNGNFVLGDVKITQAPLDPKEQVQARDARSQSRCGEFEQKNVSSSRKPSTTALGHWLGRGPADGQGSRRHRSRSRVMPAGFEGGTEFEVQLRFSGSLRSWKNATGLHRKSEPKLAMPRQTCRACASCVRLRRFEGTGSQRYQHAGSAVFDPRREAAARRRGQA